MYDIQRCTVLHPQVKMKNLSLNKSRVLETLSFKTTQTWLSPVKPQTILTQHFKDPPKVFIPVQHPKVFPAYHSHIFEQTLYIQPRVRNSTVVCKLQHRM